MSETETSAPVCYRHPDRPTYISCQRCGRPICPQCQTQAAVGVQCPECMREGRADYAVTRPGGPGVGGFFRRMLPRGATPVVTFTLMGLCVLLYVVQLTAGASFTNAWSLAPWQLRTEPWRLLTSAFLHSPTSFLHILFNLYALFIFGPALERFLGRARFVALYLIGAIGASLGEVLVYQLWVATNGRSADLFGGLLTPAQAVGASGAIFALMGALLVLHRAMALDRVQILIVVAANLALGFFVRGIAWEVHLAGLAVGALLGAILLRTRKRSQRTRQIVLLAAVAVGVVVVCGACIAAAPSAYA